MTQARGFSRETLCLTTSSKRKQGKNTRRSAWMNKEILDKLHHKKEAY